MTVIRKSQKSDSESYAHTLLLTLPCDDLKEAQENANIIMERLERGKRELWVADVDAIPVGFMLLEFEKDDQNIEIDWFDIHPDYQRRCVGAMLVQKAEERAKEHRYLTITMHTAASNQRMRIFAEKNGFVEAECLPEFWGEGTEDAYVLLKNVN
jgi:ribosomal protein S18 acetylase RimI-like enzyme